MDGFGACIICAASLPFMVIVPPESEEQDPAITRTSSSIIPSNITIASINLLATSVSLNQSKQILSPPPLAIPAPSYMILPNSSQSRVIVVPQDTVVPDTEPALQANAVGSIGDHAHIIKFAIVG